MASLTWRRGFGQIPRMRTAVATGPGWMGALALAATFGVLVLLVQRYDAPMVLLAGGVLLAGAALLLRPELATVLTVFLLYTNVPSILTRRHDVPVSVAGCFIFLLCSPLLYALIIRRQRLLVDTTLGLMLTYLGVVVLSGLVAVDPDETTEYVTRFVLEGLLVYLLVVNAVRNLATLRRVVWTMLAAGSLLGALTLYQEVTGAIDQEFGGLAERNYEFAMLRSLDVNDAESRELIREFVEANGPSGRSQRANGPLDEPNRYAQIMVVLLPLAVVAYRSARSSPARVAALACAALAASAVVFTASRGAFLAIVLLGILAGWMRWISRAQLQMAALAGILLVPVVAPEYVNRVTTLVGITSLAEGQASTEADGALKGRAAAMTAATRVFADHPLLGVGAGQFQPYYSAEYQLNDPRFRFRNVRNYHAHSLYLQLAAELGALGLAAFLAIFVFLLRDLERARRRWAAIDPRKADVVVALGFGILAYLGTSLFLHIGGQRYLWLLVALASAALHALREEERADAVMVEAS